MHFPDSVLQIYAGLTILGTLRLRGLEGGYTYSTYNNYRGGLGTCYRVFYATRELLMQSEA